MTRFRDIGFSTSSSNSGSGSTTPTPSTDDKEKEDDKKDDSKLTYDDNWVERDADVEAKYPVNLKNGSYTSYKYAKTTNDLSVTVKAPTTNYKEAKLQAGIDFDYKTGRFYRINSVVKGDEEEVVDTGLVYVIDGGYYFKESLGSVLPASVRWLDGPDWYWFEDDNHNGTHDPGEAEHHENTAARDWIDTDRLFIDGVHANNENTGIFNLNDERSADEATVAGALNPDLWWKDANGNYHKIVSEKRAYQNDAGNDWNYKQNAGGDVQFDTYAGIWSEVFYWTAAVTTEDCFVISETPYVRTEKDKVGSDTHEALRYSRNTAVSVSDAGKENFSTWVADATGMNYGEALAKGGLKDNWVDNINVHKVSNEYFDVLPAAGYRLEIDGTGRLIARRYTKDFKLACDLNNKFMKVGNLYVEREAVAFSDDAIKNAMYVKPGYIRYDGKYYKEIPYSEDNSTGWMITGSIIKENWNPESGAYNKNERKNFNEKLADGRAVAKKTKSKMPTDLTNKYIEVSYWGEAAGDLAICAKESGAKYYGIVVTKPEDIFEGYDVTNRNELKKYIQDPATGRWYVEK